MLVAAGAATGVGALAAHAVVVALGVALALGRPAAAATAAPSSGCALPEPAFAPGTSTNHWLVTPDGRDRVWSVHVPVSYVHNRTEGSAVVVAMHGGLGNGNQTERDYLLNDEAVLHGFVVVYPTGWQNTWNAGACCGKSMAENIDEVGFLLRVLDAVEASLCIDRRRVYATGMSNGGLMAFRLACEASDRIAAVAPVAGSLELSPCTPRHPVAVMMIHGTNDRNIRWEGGVGCGISGTNFTSIPASIDAACAFNDCGCVYANRSRCGAEYYSYGDGTCTQHGGAPWNATTVLCAIHGGGHTWPKLSDNPPPTAPADPTECDKTYGNFPANSAMWSFFSMHSRAVGLGRAG